MEHTNWTEDDSHKAKRIWTAYQKTARYYRFALDRQLVLIQKADVYGSVTLHLRSSSNVSRKV